ncbi:ATP-binding protein [Paenibacillus sp. GCM10012307]|uniref:histidine kinase n=1 Tax=Paenibacillus roseus TaxID=2798579 RepID=A0A934MLV9_9BACL|nr:ATP-binding protein [Paenibacillus roseus]MBJ6362635.1 PAS domain S-box protein [Paenibacillus roseus]
MSIKLKLSLCISLVVAAVLTLNISIYYFTTMDRLVTSAKQQSQAIAEQISSALEATSHARNNMEESLGQMLRMAAISARKQLPADIDQITNEELSRLSLELNVDDITLWRRTGSDIIAVKSSEPDELNISSSTWGYWHTAFNQLLDHREVTIPQGQKLKDFWSGPYNFAASNPDKIIKWGYYYDGTTNYMINPYISVEPLIAFNDRFKQETIPKLTHGYPGVLEINGFDPEFFGKEPILRIKKGRVVYNLDVRAVLFGSNNFANPDPDEDVRSIQTATSTGEIQTQTATIKERMVTKYFIPIQGESKPNVFNIVLDQKTIVKPLYDQLLMQVIISSFLLIITLVGSYFLSGILIRSLKKIVHKVNEISSGSFGTKIELKNTKDELGQLAEQVNSMADNLQHYMNRLQNSAEELRSTKEYLESFINHTSDAIHVSDLQGNITQANKAFWQIYGWSFEEIQGQPLPGQLEEIRAEEQDLIRRIIQGETVTGFETERLTKHGKHVDVSLTISPIRNGQEEIVAIATISRNITDRKRTEEMILRSEKLSVVGQLAAGVAHEVRNPLTTLRGFVQLQKTKGTVSQSHLNIMLAELDRINFIVSEFLVLAKPQVISIQTFNLRKLLNDLVMLLDGQANLDKIQINLPSEGHPAYVTGEPNQLKQVFVNLLKNAMEAMPGGGTIAMEIEQNTQGKVIVRVIDEGVGISREDLQHLGEPFFSRKDTGTGLGLMICQQIISHHNGILNVYSELGKGTTVEVALPGAAKRDAGEQNSE